MSLETKKTHCPPTPLTALSGLTPLRANPMPPDGSQPEPPLSVIFVSTVCRHPLALYGEGKGLFSGFLFQEVSHWRHI